MSLDPVLLEIVRCPDEHHAPLTYDEAGQTLTCTECGRIFEIRDGIPVLLLDEARTPEPGGAAADAAGPGDGAADTVRASGAAGVATAGEQEA